MTSYYREMLSVNISRQTDQNKLDWIKKKFLNQTAVKVQSKVVFFTFLKYLWIVRNCPSHSEWILKLTHNTVHFLHAQLVSVYEIAICRVVEYLGLLKVTGKTTALTPQHLCTTKDLWRLRLVSCLDDDAIDDCKLFKVCFVFKWEGIHIATTCSRHLHDSMSDRLTLITLL